MTATTPQRYAAPRDVVCPNCNAQPGKACTQPTNTARSRVNWYHLARERVPARYVCKVCGDPCSVSGISGALVHSTKVSESHSAVIE